MRWGALPELRMPTRTCGGVLSCLSRNRGSKCWGPLRGTRMLWQPIWTTLSQNTRWSWKEFRPAPTSNSPGCCCCIVPQPERRISWGTLPPDAVARFADAHDEGLWRSMCRLINIPEDQDEATKFRATMPLHLEGLVLRSACTTEHGQPPESPCLLNPLLENLRLPPRQQAHESQRLIRPSASSFQGHNDQPSSTLGSHEFRVSAFLPPSCCGKDCAIHVSSVSVWRTVSVEGWHQSRVHRQLSASEQRKPVRHNLEAPAIRCIWNGHVQISENMLVATRTPACCTFGLWHSPVRTHVSPTLQHENKLRGGGRKNQARGHTDRRVVRREGRSEGVATAERGRVAALCGWKCWWVSQWGNTTASATLEPHQSSRGLWQKKEHTDFAERPLHSRRSFVLPTPSLCARVEIFDLPVRGLDSSWQCRPRRRGKTHHSWQVHCSFAGSTDGWGVDDSFQPQQKILSQFGVPLLDHGRQSHQLAQKAACLALTPSLPWDGLWHTVTQVWTWVEQGCHELWRFFHAVSDLSDCSSSCAIKKIARRQNGTTSIAFRGWHFYWWQKSQLGTHVENIDEFRSSGETHARFLIKCTWDVVIVHVRQLQNLVDVRITDLGRSCREAAWLRMMWRLTRRQKTWEEICIERNC